MATHRRHIQSHPVKGWAEYVGGTLVRFFCINGHSWVEDLEYPRGKQNKLARLDEAAVKHYASWWSKEKGGVWVTCKKCAKNNLL